VPDRGDQARRGLRLFACYNHTYRDSIPGFLDLVRDLSERDTREFRKRWTDNEIAALWQAMAFKVEYRCFNCVATCPRRSRTPSTRTGTRAGSTSTRR